MSQTSTGAIPRPALTDRGGRRWIALVVLSLAQLMVVLDGTIVNIALPSAQADLGFDDDARQWVVTGYALAFGSLLLLGGRLSDFFGRKRMFLIGLVGFAAASALGGAADSIELLITARILQGVFGAMLAPASLSLVSVTFTAPTERARAFTVYGTITGAGGAIGLLLGGILTESLSWHWCLYVNVVIAAVAIVGGIIFLRDSEKTTGHKLDIPGTITAVAGLVGIVYGLGNAEAEGWDDFATLGPIIAGVILLIAFVLVERRSSHPLLPMRVILDRDRGAAYLAMGISGAGMFAIFLFLTYYMANTLGYSAIQTGTAFLPMTAALMVGATLSGAILLPRVGPRPLVPIGAILAAAGLVLLTFIDADTEYVSGILPAILILGFGLGMVFAPVQNAATSGVRAQDAGVASAMVNTGQQIGGSIGTAVFSSLAATAISNYLTDHADAMQDPNTLIDATLTGYHQVFWVGAAVFVACAIVTALLFRSGPLPINPDAEPVIAH